MNRYKINKIGLLNFWLYDSEEFYFSEGKLLLRGSNGSGKSVTMQSFIPLLFDGNKSSERLDSFGSKSRKIDDYLIMEGSNEEEHIGYLYMELYNKETDNYLTIGMGLKAVRNKGTTFWGFALTNNQRINHDFVLYKNRVGREPLTKKELIASIGNQGIVVETMKEYKKMVNDLVFGFSNMDMYDEFINLLLQIRSPKLSNSYKPKDLTQILSNVLQPLSEEEIMPMSDAIMQMNKTKEQIEELNQEQKALQYLLPFYKEYNERLLYDKALNYFELFNSQKEEELNILELEKTSFGLSEDLEKQKIKKKELEDEYSELSFKQKSFDNKELLNLTENINSCQNELQICNHKLMQKEEIKTRKKDQVLEYENKAKAYQNELDKINYSISDLLRDLEECENELYFEDFTFYSKEFKDNKQNYNGFKDWENAIKSYQNTLNELLQKVDSLQMIELKIDENKQKYDSIDEQIKNINKEISVSQNKLLEAIDDYKEYLVSYSKENQELKIDEETLKRLYQLLDNFNDYVLIDIKNILNDLVTKKTLEYSSINAKYEEEISSKEIEKNTIQEEIIALKNEQIFDPFLEMNEATEYLKNEKIPHLPFYKAVSFKKDIDLETKNNIEAALVEMGIINACIISKEHLPKVLNKYKAKYLVEGEMYNNNISQYFDIIETDMINKQTILSVLQSISSDDKELFYINKKGTYRANLMVGQNINYQHKYIGKDVLEKHIDNRLKDLDLKIDILNNEQTILSKTIYSNNNKIEILKNEISHLKDIDKLKEIANAIKTHNLNLSFQKQNLENSISEYNMLNTKKSEINASILEYKDKYFGKYDVESITSVKNNTTYYLTIIHELSKEQINYSNKNEQILSNQFTLEQVSDDLETILEEIVEINHNSKQLQMKIDNLNTLLNDNNLIQLKQELLNITSRLDHVNLEIAAISTEITKKEKDIEYLNRDVVLKKEAQSKGKEKLNILELILNKEYQLHYVYQEEMSLMDLCKRIFKEIKVNKNITVDETYNKLLEAQFKMNTILAKFSPTLETILEINDVEDINLDLKTLLSTSKRSDIIFKYNNKQLNLFELVGVISNNLEEYQLLSKEEDRKLFQDILINNVSFAIRKRIYASEEWIQSIKELMESMQTSSGLSFSISWTNVDGETEDEVNTREIVNILKKDPKLVIENDEEMEKITKHFRSKIRRAEESTEDPYYYNIIFDVLDYRKWFQFKLYYKRTGDDKKELTDKYFNKFSGGEKAIAMYIPLFASIYAKYKSAREDSLKVIALDEAFAGVDDDNIKDAFRILDSLELDYLLTSQILWGDYETIKSLAISELNRPNNSNVVSVINYKWEGNKRIFVTNQDYEAKESL